MSEQRRPSIEYTRRGKRLFAVVGAILVSAAGTPVIGKALSGDNKPKPTPTLYERMDAGIAREIPKGPGSNDEVIARPAILPNDNITGIMSRTDVRADYDRPGVSALQRKATIASNDTPEVYYGYPNDEPERQEHVVMWLDAELQEEFGEPVILGIPEDQIQQP